MASMSPSEYYRALATASPDRPDELLHEAKEMCEAEKFIYNSIKVDLKQGERSAYFALSSVPPLPMICDCTSAGSEVWANKGESEGKFKMGMQMNPDAIKVLQIFEVLIRLKIVHSYPDSSVAQRLECSQETNINVEYMQLKADISLPPNRYPVSLCRQLANSDAVVRVPNDVIRSPYDEGGLPSVNKELDANTRKRISTDPIVNYAMNVEIQPTIVIMDRVKWQVKRVIVKGPTQTKGGVFRKPIPLSTMATSNTLWDITPQASAGGYGNHYHSMTHSNSPNPKFSASFWLHGQSDAENLSTVTPLRVAHVWEKQDTGMGGGGSQGEATLAVATTPQEGQLIQKVCDDIKGAVAERLPDLQKKYKPPKANGKAKKTLEWSDALNFTGPSITQTPEKIEKWGERTDNWFKLPVHFRGDPGRGTKATRIYGIDGILAQNRDAINVSDLLSCDPEKLVQDGMLKHLTCDNAFSLGKGAEIYAAVCVSKINTSPKFSYGFRVEYIIALSAGDLNDDSNGDMTLENGTVVQIATVADFAEVMQAEKRKREATSCEKENKRQCLPERSSSPETMPGDQSD